MFTKLDKESEGILKYILENNDIHYKFHGNTALYNLIELGYIDVEITRLMGADDEYTLKKVNHKAMIYFNQKETHRNNQQQLEKEKKKNTRKDTILKVLPIILSALALIISTLTFFLK